VCLLRRHNHSRHLPRMRRSQTITACNLHLLDVVSRRCLDQSSNHTGASRPLIDTCMAVVLPGRLKDTAIAQGPPRVHMATKAPLTRAARRCRRLRSRTNPWSSKANAPTQALRTMHTHEILARTTTYPLVRTVSPTGLVSQNRTRGTCTILPDRGVLRMAHQRSADGRWGNHTILDPILQSSWVA